MLREYYTTKPQAQFDGRDCFLMTEEQKQEVDQLCVEFMCGINKGASKCCGLFGGCSGILFSGYSYE